MGLLDFIKPKSPLEKAAEQVREVYAQPEYRRGAMDKLFELGTEDAYRALLKRFTISAHGQIADEAEKRELVDQLVALGEPVLDALKEFVRTEKKSLSFPIRALTRILDKPDAIAFFRETLESYEPLDHRSSFAKRTLIITLGEMVDPSEAHMFVPYLEDHDDDVQIQAIVAVERLAEPSTAEGLVNVCCGDANAARVQRRAAQALVELGWSVRDKFPSFHEELRSEYILGKKGQLLKKRVATADGDA